MTKLLLVLSFALASFTLSAQSSHLCGAPTKSTGNPCKNKVLAVGQHCHLHGGSGGTAKLAVPTTQCTATAKSTGNRCKNKTTNQSGLCHMHSK